MLQMPAANLTLLVPLVISIWIAGLLTLLTGRRRVAIWTLSAALGATLLLLLYLQWFPPFGRPPG
jgi:hypothetical protein